MLVFFFSYAPQEYNLKQNIFSSPLFPLNEKQRNSLSAKIVFNP